MKGSNQQLQELERQKRSLELEKDKSKSSVDQLSKIKTALEEELTFQNGINSALVTTILDHIVVKKDSTREVMRLDIHLKLGEPYEAIIDRKNSSFSFNRLKNIIPAKAIRMTSVSIGTIGLIKAVNTFDSSKGIRLSSYAARCIENEVLMFFRNGKKSAQDVSMNEPIDTDKEGNTLTLMDVMSTEDNIVDNLDIKIKSEQLKKYLVEVLTPRERIIIELRYGLNGSRPLTQREVAQRLKISRSYVYLIAYYK